MESIGALVGCSVALAVGVVLGYRWTLGAPWHLIAGFVVGAICSAFFFAVANWMGRTFPGLLDPRQVGLHFLGLAIAAPFIGAFGAWFGYRKSLGRGLF